MLERKLFISVKIPGLLWLRGLTPSKRDVVYRIFKDYVEVQPRWRPMMAENCASQCILMKDPTTEGLESLRKWFDRFSMRRTMENKAAVPMDIDENADSEPDDPPNAPEVASAANQQSEPEVVYANLKEYQASLTLNAFRFHYDVNIFRLFLLKEIFNF